MPWALLSSRSGGHSAYGLCVPLPHPGLSMTWLCSRRHNKCHWERGRSPELRPGLHVGVLSDTGLSPLCAYVSQFLLR